MKNRSKFKPHPKYSEAVLKRCCRAARHEMIRLYGEDEFNINVKKNRDGVARAIRRDVIAVLEGATARTLHMEWVARRLPDGVHLAERLRSLFEENPTLRPWFYLSDDDKLPFLRFEKVVHEAYFEAVQQQKELAAKGLPTKTTLNFIHSTDVTSIRCEGKVTTASGPGEFHVPDSMSDDKLWKYIAEALDAGAPVILHLRMKP